MEFDWDDGNIAKCLKHGVSRADIEDVLNGEPRVIPDSYPVDIEPRFRAIGVTMAGRHVFIVFTFRDRNDQMMVRPISARYMHAKEVQHYEGQK